MCFKLKILVRFLWLRISRKIYTNQLHKLRTKRWNRLQKHTNKSIYYNQLSHSKLTDYPLIDKSIFMEYFDEINTVGINKSQAIDLAIEAEETRDFSPMINGITVGLSTGTSGNRGIFLASENEKAMWVGAILDRVIGLTFKKRKVAFFLRANSNLYQAVGSKLLEFHFFDLLNDLDKNLQQLNELKPDLIVAQPSMLSHIADALTNSKIEIMPNKVVSVAEVLSPEDKARFEAVFKQTIHQVYQCTEGFLAATCECGYLHFNEDFLIIEKNYVDDDKTRFHPIITDLSRRSQPVIRYELNDIITEKKDCRCGSKMMAIEQIEGRSDDVFTLQNEADKEVFIFPDLLRRTIVLSDEKIQDYALIQSGPNQMKLYLKGLDVDFDLVKADLLAFFSSKGIQNVFIEELLECPHQMGDKKRRIKNDYKKTN